MRPRHPAHLIGGLLTRLIIVNPVDHAAIQALLAEEEAEAQATSFPGSDGLRTMGSPAA